jgi:hypothetical protein
MAGAFHDRPGVARRRAEPPSRDLGSGVDGEGVVFGAEAYDFAVGALVGHDVVHEAETGQRVVVGE